MKKIAIVSCYNQHNYGSMLQAYATQWALDRLGYENETINISGLKKEIKKSKFFYFIKASLTSDILLSKMGMLKNTLIKRVFHNEYTEKSRIRSQKFDEFSQKYFRLSFQYNSKAELGGECKKYSTVLVGSDQLWLPANIAADYYTLSFVPNYVNTIAYATSFGQDELPNALQKKAEIFLTKIRHISVREESGQKLIKKLTGRNIPVVCDPTLLFTGDEWMSIQKQQKIISQPYIFCYFLGHNSLHRDFAKRLRNITGCKIVALTHLDEFVKIDEDYADENPYNIDPSDFLNLIRNAAYVCTDSFHCSAFSLLYRRIFFTFRRYSRKTKLSTNGRLDMLFKMTGIKDRIFQGNEDVLKCLNMKIDYDMVHQKLKKFRKDSFDYLSRAIKDEGSTDF